MKKKIGISGLNEQDGRQLVGLIGKTVGRKAYITSKDIEHLEVSIDRETEQYTVTAFDNFLNELYVVEGFANSEDAWHYARIITRMNGLSEKRIDEVSTQYALITLTQNKKGLYKVYGQGIAPNGQMELKLLGSFNELEEANDEADFLAATNDCPIVEIIERPILREAY